jgi:PAS domain S-box-containing protein
VTDDELCRRLVRDAADAIIAADGDGRIRLWNAGAERVFGFAAAEVLDRSLDCIIPEKQRAAHWEGYRRVMATGTSRYGAGELLAVPALRKDGTRISIEFTITMVRDDDGRPSRLVAIVRDVTARWQRERELQARLRALEPSPR